MVHVICLLCVEWVLGQGRERRGEGVRISSPTPKLGIPIKPSPNTSHFPLPIQSNNTKWGVGPRFWIRARQMLMPFAYGLWADIDALNSILHNTLFLFLDSSPSFFNTTPSFLSWSTSFVLFTSLPLILLHSTLPVILLINNILRCKLLPQSYF